MANTYKYYPERAERLTPEFVATEYDRLIERIAGAEAAESADAWIELFGDWNALKAYVSGEESRGYYSRSRYMDDPGIEASEKAFREEVLPVAEKGNAALVDAFVASRYAEAVAEHWGEYLLRSLKLQSEPLAPINSDLRVEAGDLVDRYDRLVATAEVTFRGERMTLSRVGSFATSENPEIRKGAFETVRGWFVDNRNELAAIFDRLVELRHGMALNLGHENFIPLGYMGMGRTDYGPEEVERFRQSVRRYAVPLQQKLFELQAEELGTPTLKPWDSAYTPWLTLPPGIAPVETQLEKAQQVFDSLSPKLGGHFARMREEGLIDLENRRGKRAGAFCTSFPDEGRVAILCNSTGNENDISTLMHEMGHAFQGWESQPIAAVDLQWPTADAAEIYSTGMEYLSMRHIGAFLAPEHAEKFRRGRWKESVELLCLIALIDEFQHRIYQNPGATPDERDRIWRELWDVYKPGVDYEGLDAYKTVRWYQQAHIFRLPFYFIDYAIAETGAMQLALIDAGDHERAMEIYLRLCRIGGTMSVLDIFQAAGLRSPFDPAVMEELMKHAASELGVQAN